MTEHAKSIQLEIHNAVTVVTQKAEELYSLLNSVSISNDRYQRRLDEYERELQLLRNVAPVSQTVQSRDLMKRIEALQTQLDTKTLENERLREFGKLKDRAKMKVERDRDAYLAALSTRNKEVDALRNKVGDTEQLKQQNSAQAAAYLRVETELNNARAMHLRYKKRLEVLESQRDHWEGEYNRLRDKMARVRHVVGE